MRTGFRRRYVITARLVCAVLLLGFFTAFSLDLHQIASGVFDSFRYTAMRFHPLFPSDLQRGQSCSSIALISTPSCNADGGHRVSAAGL